MPEQFGERGVRVRRRTLKRLGYGVEQRLQFGWEVAADFGEYGGRKGAIGEEVSIINFPSKMREYGWPERFVEPMICVVASGFRGVVARRLSG